MAVQAITADLEQLGLSGPGQAPVATGNSWDHLLDEMDAIEDPFEQMAYALYMLMPAILDDQEEKLDGRATDLEGLGGVTTAAADVHETFNSFSEFKVSEWAQAEERVQQLETELKTLQQAVKDGVRDPAFPEKGGFIDPDLAGQVDESIEEMLAWIKEKNQTGDAGFHLIEVWDTEVNKNRLGNVQQYNDGKFWLDNLNTVETSFKSVSGVAQTELQFEIGFYEVMVGSYKDMFQNYKGQVQSAVDGSKRS